MTTVGYSKASWALTSFGGEFDSLAELLRNSWSENQSQSLLYTSQFLQSWFASPGASYELAPTIYQGSVPVAFVAGFPRRIQYKDRVCNVVVSTLLTVSPEHKKKGYGIVVWNELVRRAQALGFDGMVNYCIDGEAMDGMVVRCCNSLRLPVERICSVSYMTKVLWSEPLTSTALEPTLGATRLLAEAEAISRSASVSRLWTREEAHWQCNRCGAISTNYESGPRHGMLTGYIIELNDVNRTRTLLVDDILWGSLNSDERPELVRQFLGMAFARGARIASVPMLGYADMEPFRLARFRASSRVLHAYFARWGSLPAVGQVPSLYLDVF